MTTYRVLVSDKLSEAGLKVLKATPGLEVLYKPGLSEEDLAKAIVDVDALVIRSGSKVTAKVLEAARQLKVIGRAGIGVDNVDVPAASRRGVIVMNTPFGNTITTAEHAISLLLSLARKIPQATASMKAGKWEKSKFEGREVTGKTLGIIGLGNIGRIVAARAQGLEMRVIAFDPMLSADKAADLGVTLVSLDELFATSDFITLHTPLTPDTKNLIGEGAIAKMKKGVLIVNAARGGIVDEAALLKGIEAGKVGGAALDVFPKEPPDPASPALHHDAIILTPHLGASTEEAQERVALEVAEQVADYLRNGTVKNAVNMLAVSPELARKLEPFQRLAERLGTLVAALSTIDAKEIRVTCAGDPAELGLRAVASAGLAGFLKRFMDVPVNAVSGPVLAKERGISFVEAREPAVRHTHLVRVDVRGDRGNHSAAGTLSADGTPRLAVLDGHEIDAHLAGTTLVMRNEDKPGVIGAVGTILGKNGINVSRMQLGLDEKKGHAMAFWNATSAVPEGVLEELRKLPFVQSVLSIEL